MEVCAVPSGYRAAMQHQEIKGQACVRRPRGAPTAALAVAENWFNRLVWLVIVSGEEASPPFTFLIIATFDFHSILL